MEWNGNGNGNGTRPADGMNQCGPACLLAPPFVRRRSRRVVCTSSRRALCIVLDVLYCMIPGYWSQYSRQLRRWWCPCFTSLGRILGWLRVGRGGSRVGPVLSVHFVCEPYTSVSMIPCGRAPLHLAAPTPSLPACRTLNPYPPRCRVQQEDGKIMHATITNVQRERLLGGLARRRGEHHLSRCRSRRLDPAGPGDPSSPIMPWIVCTSLARLAQSEGGRYSVYSVHPVSCASIEGGSLRQCVVSFTVSGWEIARPRRCFEDRVSFL